MKVRQINRLLFLFLIFSCYLVKLSAQDKSNPKETFSEAESFFLFEEYLDALPLYIKLKDEFPNNYNLDYKIGRCYLNMPYEKTKAITFLETAVDNISIVSRDNTLKEQKAPLDALFYLGDAYRINNQLERAIQTYNDFKKRTTDKIFDFTLVDDEIKACRLALILEKRPVTVVTVNLGEIVNTRFSESNPVVTPDETMIVYAAKLPFYQAMFYSKRENGRWSTPVNMIPELGIDGDCFPTSISPDGTELYLYRSNEYLGDLYVTNFKNGKWGKIRKLNGNINTKYWESHACISSDGKTLYFTSNRKGGYGGLDIYKTSRTSTTNDDWGPAQNLGPVINSSYNDDTPFITADGKRLYFSSFGHETMGGYDIFYSDFNADGTWGKPVNMG
ncbi:MAG TPA: tetratricopeptide repeat protein, partial [Bacteroidales bacterium]